MGPNQAETTIETAPAGSLAVLLGALVPGVPVLEAMRAAQEAAEAPSLEARLQRALSELGVTGIEVEGTLRDLAAAGTTSKVLVLEEPPAVISRLTPEVAVFLEADGRQRIIRASAWPPTVKKFFVPIVGRELDYIHGSSGLARLIKYLSKESGLVGTLVVYAVGYEVMSLAGPLTVQVLINNISFGMLMQPLIVLSVLLLSALVGAAALRLLQVWAIEHLVRRFVFRVAVDLGARFNHREAPVAFPEHRFFETVGVDKAFFVLGLDVVGLLLQLLAATILLSLYHPLLLGYALVLLALAWLIVRLPFKSALERSMKESASKYKVAEWLADRGGAQSQSEHVLEGRARVDDWLTARKASFRIAMIQQAGLFALEVLFAVALLIVGGHLVIQGQLSLGQLVAAELVTTLALVSLAKLGKQLPTVYDVITSLDKLGHLVDHSQTRPGTAEEH